MRLFVRHRTSYRYDAPSGHLVQLLRMTPRDCSSQSVERWSLRDEQNHPLVDFLDAFGNRAHLHTIAVAHAAVAIEVEGVVETRDTAGVVRGAPEPLPPAVFLRTTPLTAPAPELRALADEVRGEGGPLAQLHALMGLVHERIAYRTGSTDVGTPAAAALAAGSGVCQDHAQVFVAASRLLGHPARYVSGYLHADSAEDPTALASHAWAEAWVEHLGWVGFDASHALCPTDRYIRTSVGLDYQGAAPVRGVRRGPGGQSVSVQLQVREIGEQ